MIEDVLFMLGSRHSSAAIEISQPKPLTGCCIALKVAREALTPHGKIQPLNRYVSTAYSPAINAKGENRGEQGTEAVEPGSQEAEAE